MRSITPWARVYVIAVALGAVLCAAPVRSAHAPWGAVALFAALCAACEQLAVGRFAGAAIEVRAPPVPGAPAAGRPGGTPPSCSPAPSCCRPPPPRSSRVPGALLARVEQRPPWPRRLWRAGPARPRRLGGLPGARGRSAAADAVGTPDFPYALLPRRGRRARVLPGPDRARRRHPGARPSGCPRTAAPGAGLLRPRSLAPVAVHGLAGLMMAVLWRSPYGPVAALLVLLPMYVSCWVFAQYHRERAAHQATIRALVQAVDIKDGYTRGHSERVGQASDDDRA